MTNHTYDIIVIGCGSAGLSTGLFMNEVGLKVLMIAKSDQDIGGDCLNDGCVPSKAFIHVAKIAHNAKLAENFGLKVNGSLDIKKAIEYVYGKQEIIRKHENAAWLRTQGVDVELGGAHFTGRQEIEVEGIRHRGKKIVIATGSRPRKLTVKGIEKVKYYDNESIFHIAELPKRLLVVGGGPIGIEIAQAMSRLGSVVTVVHKGEIILEHDDQAVTKILLQQLKEEGIKFLLNANLEHFSSGDTAEVKFQNDSREKIIFDAVFVGIGRDLNIENLGLEYAGVDIKDGKITVDDYLRTTNKNVFVCGDVAGSLQFSHAAEAHARILLNNFFSPINKKLSNDNLSWVTFTDPELATFGLSEKQLKGKNISYLRLEQDFKDDDRAVVDSYEYGKMVLFISSKGFFKKQTILGGTMVAPNAGELIQELILANTKELSLDSLFDKIYPYPVAGRINQKAILEYKLRSFTGAIKRLLRIAYSILS